MHASFEWLDWLVIAVYAIGMIAIGVHYSHASSVDEFMLGGRKMKPWMVGISYYATFMSTLTYLASPGEMIRHGPMMFCGILAYPLIFLVVGGLLIPHIMRLRVTSAYEILELRLGLSVRLLGSAIFLALRLFWMALIVYATADSVLVPLMGLPKSSTLWIGFVMAGITFAYASLGGLQAVVVTDVVQTFIMLAGAILSIVVITINLGGVSEWIPTQWSPQWDEPRFLFSTDSRLSVSAAMLSVFVWYVCTAGSDQIAIQRYLSTRDASSARRMFAFALVCDTTVSALLAMLGLALFAYFNRHPELLSSGQTVASSADSLLPTFIVRVLPTGLSGLVVAGMLSAAMDSLSAGLNSAASVVSEDWIDRFRRTPLSETARVRQAKIVSCLIGVVVVTISMLSDFAAGNLVEKCYKIVNLMVTPLFVLFFMAMFLPWATVFGTWAAAIAATGVAVGIAFFGAFGLSFVWIMPISLIAGIAVGALVSLAPIGAKRPMLETNP